MVYASRLLSGKEGVMVCEGGILESKIGVEGACGVGFGLFWSVLLFFSPAGALDLAGGGGGGAWAVCCQIHGRLSPGLGAC